MPRPYELQARWTDLPDVLAEAIEASLPPREDRDLDAPLFAGANATARLAGVRVAL